MERILISDCRSSCRIYRPRISRKAIPMISALAMFSRRGTLFLIVLLTHVSNNGGSESPLLQPECDSHRAERRVCRHFRVRLITPLRSARKGFRNTRHRTTHGGRRRRRLSLPERRRLYL